MKREWRPGDVALLQVGAAERIGLRTHMNDGWRTPAGLMSDSTTPWGSIHRPLVVIDPEDREQVARLADALSLRGVRSTTREEFARDNIADALREFADPISPKPAEPLGLGAVVETDGGTRYVRLTDGYWVSEDESQPWRNVNALRVLSEGVTA